MNSRQPQAGSSMLLAAYRKGGTLVSDKISAALVQAMEAQGAEEDIPIIVKYRTSREGIFEPMAVPGGVQPTHRYRMINAAAMTAKAKHVEALSQEYGVEKIWIDQPVHTCLDVSVPLVRVPQVWALGFRGQGVKVGIVDTGIDPNHPDLAGRVVAKTSFVGGDGTDDNGHGTHVAGIVAGNGQASGGKYRGVAPEASLYAAKVLNADGSGMMSGVMAGVEWAVQQGVQVINLSLGSPGPCDGTDALSETCDAAVAAGVVVCVAAGNAGPGSSTVGSPGCARQVITVGASDDHDGMAGFSSRGPTSDGRIKPDLVFPGVGIVACRANGTSMGSPVDQHYTNASGTSMATPHASGPSALLLQAKPGWTPAQGKEALMKAAVDLGQTPNTQGAGRADGDGRPARGAATRCLAGCAAASSSTTRRPPAPTCSR